MKRNLGLLFVLVPLLWVNAFAQQRTFNLPELGVFIELPAETGDWTTKVFVEKDGPRKDTLTRSRPLFPTLAFYMYFDRANTTCAQWINRKMPTLRTDAKVVDRPPQLPAGWHTSVIQDQLSDYYCLELQGGVLDVDLVHLGMKDASTTPIIRTVLEALGSASIRRYGAGGSATGGGSGSSGDADVPGSTTLLLSVLGLTIHVPPGVGTWGTEVNTNKEGKRTDWVRRTDPASPALILVIDTAQTQGGCAKYYEGAKESSEVKLNRNPIFYSPGWYSTALEGDKVDLLCLDVSDRMMTVGVGHFGQRDFLTREATKVLLEAVRKAAIARYGAFGTRGYAPPPSGGVGDSGTKPLLLPVLQLTVRVPQDAGEWTVDVRTDDKGIRTDWLKRTSPATPTLMIVVQTQRMQGGCVKYYEGTEDSRESKLNRSPVFYSPGWYSTALEGEKVDMLCLDLSDRMMSAGVVHFGQKDFLTREAAKSLLEALRKAAIAQYGDATR